MKALMILAAMTILAPAALVTHIERRHAQCRSGGEDHIWVSRSHTCLVMRDGVLTTISETPFK